MLLPLADGGRGAVGPDAAAAVLARLPGDWLPSRWGRGSPGVAPTTDFVRELCAAAVNFPLLLDADALHALAAIGPTGDGQARRFPAVLTPHPGELARLLGTSVAAARCRPTASRRARCRALRRGRGAQGRPHDRRRPRGGAWINPTGNPGMAAPGMGDVLAGLIAAHLARGWHPSRRRSSGCTCTDSRGSWPPRTPARGGCSPAMSPTVPAAVLRAAATR